jgi:hypothetical protein
MLREWDRKRRGNAVVEFAIAFSLLLMVFAGVWQFGYTFYQYNTLETAVRNGARYASLATYDGGSWGGAAFKARVKNMVVYGNPNPPGGATPVVPGLTTSNVTVTETFNGSVPTKIRVEITNFVVSSMFREMRLDTKPRCTFEYTGRFTVPVS